jgi:polyphosphate kinase
MLDSQTYIDREPLARFQSARARGAKNESVPLLERQFLAIFSFDVEEFYSAR